MHRRDLWLLFLRYLLLLIIAIPNLYLFYLIFTPLTIYLVCLILKLFYYPVFILASSILIKGLLIDIIPACVAGAAYYLLLALNLTTPLNFKTRIKSIAFLFASFLVLNVLRISIFISLALSGFQYFDIAHRISWYAGSTILVLLIWFINARLFRIKAIPVYSDMKSLIKIIKKK